jgi:heat shock protein HslJ
MKKFALLFFVLSLPLLASCGFRSGLASAFPAESDLLAQRYVLQSVNGKAVAWERMPEIEFGEGMQVSGQVCNRFFGPGTYEKGVLTVSNMAMTMMFCLDSELNQLESDFVVMLREGVRVGLEKDTLTLSGEKMSLVYRAE